MPQTPAERQPLPLFGLTDKVLRVFYDVYNELGPGFPEFICRRALIIGLQCAVIDVHEEMPIPVWFRGVKIVGFRADIVVPSGPLLIEVKATGRIEPHHEAQVLSYLKASAIEVALILNFGRQPQFKRLVFENSRKTVPDGGGDLVEC